MDDPNADLVGYEFQGERGPLVVTGTPSWSQQYVNVELRDHPGEGLSVRSVKSLRYHRTKGWA